ncbi:aminopeptidase N [Streptomyces sp. QHH-9511]|uniref:aminopeptidase N n=1 Tax=Streptomyces sp. QHH-9511 TaxID=2684468 RepID=UPI001318EBD5|nr:aminopeptidase N [Streptomyces sp. QHH-9511]QGZ51128.1 aminopeptidase N [Streptomyces sp. QHH-9511]
MPSLTHEEARGRGSLLKVRGYHVDLDLTTGPTVFRSTTKISFDTLEPGGETFLDIDPAVLHSITLNGCGLPTENLSDGRFPLTGLAPENEVVVVADMSYSNECEGLHRYVDPADGETYVYSFVYVDNAPRVFACFDQPDLKAPYEFALQTPETWQVLGNSDAVRTGPGRWTLTESPALASYLTAVVAGPYASFRTEHDGIPLGLHCRASLADSLKADADELFEITAQCLDACNELFGVRHPFGKLDQVFVPEFSVLSLDHPGCVLLREQYLFSSAATDSERETRAVVLAHGISLMWLAGLVTNTWWDDLWLGQSLADYMAHRITSEATRFTGPPTTFAARRKGQAYVPDQRPSTHPVSLEGPDVRTVLLDLDRISYFKGHSALRQLAAHVGDDALRAGLRTFFDRHAYSTAGFADFLAAMGEAAGTDLTAWARAWLQSANVNTLTPEITVADGRITAAAVLQSAPDTHPVLRPHTMDVGLHYADDSATVRVRVDGARTELPELVGRPAPDLLLLNDGDLTYAKIRFSAGSMAALPDVLPRLSPLNRAMVWCQLLLGVQDGTFPAADHLALVTDMVREETELSILAEVLEQARHDVADRFLEPGARPTATARVADALRARLARTDADDERLITLFRALTDFTADAGELRRWLGGKGLPEGLALDTDLSWRVRYRLAVLGELDAAGIAAARDAAPGATADQYAAKCRAALPDAAAKESAWAAITSDPGLSNYELWALAEGFWQPEQAALTAPYVDRFFTEMPRAARLRGDLVLDLLLRFLYPRYAATPRTLEAAERMLALDDLPVTLRRRAADHTDDLRRAVAARALLGSGRAGE